MPTAGLVSEAAETRAYRLAENLPLSRVLNPTTHLGALHGEGTLLVEEGHRLDHVIYEIDGYLDHGIKSANGRIEAETRILKEAFCAEDATIVLDSGRCIQVVVSDPHGGTTAELLVRSGFPL